MSLNLSKLSDSKAEDAWVVYQLHQYINKLIAELVKADAETRTALIWLLGEVDYHVALSRRRTRVRAP